MALQIDNIVSNILNRELSYYGIPRIPFWLGSRKMSGFDIREVIESKPDSLDASTESSLVNSLSTFGSAVGSVSDFIRSKLDNVQWRIIKALEGNLIRLKVNPNQITITPFIRLNEAKTVGGRVYYSWVDSDGRGTEAFEVRVRGNTGNIKPDSPEARLKLYSWMKLRELTVEPRIIEVVENNQKKTVINEAFMIIRTVGIPIAILMVGFFKTPIVFSESADNPFSQDWDFVFVVKDMYPRYEDLSNYVSFSIMPEIRDRLLGTVGNIL